MNDNEELTPIEQKVRVAMAAPGPQARFVERLERELLGATHGASLHAAEQMSPGVAQNFPQDVGQSGAQGVNRGANSSAAEEILLNSEQDAAQVGHRGAQEECDGQGLPHGAGRGRAARRAPAGWGRRLAWGLAAALALLAGILLISGPARVLAGVRGLLSYLPGIGFVDPGEGLYVLSTPVSQVRDGITVTVEEIIAGADQTVVTFSVEGIRRNQRPGREDAPRCGELPRLHYREQALEMSGGESQGWASGYRSRLLFPGLGGSRRVTFDLPCLDDVIPLAAPENWSFELALQPAPPDFQALPVIVLNTATPGAAQPQTQPAAAPGTPDQGGQPGSPASETPVPAADAALTPVTDLHGVHFSVDSLVELADGFLLSGQFAWAESGYSEVSFSTFELQVSDANGVRVPVEQARDDLAWRQGYSAEEKRMTWAVRTAAKGYATPLSLRLPQVSVNQEISQFFELDLGPNPQPGQVWELNQDILVEGRRLHLIQASLAASPDGRAGTYGLTIEMSADPQEIFTVSIWDPDNHSAMLASSGGSDRRGSIIQAFTYDYLPTGLRRIEITSLSFTLAGPWTATVDLPASAAAAPPAGEPVAACLNLDNWEALQNLPSQPLPSGVGGRVLVYGPSLPDVRAPTLYVTDLYGGNRIAIGPGGHGDLSPDGRQVVYMNFQEQVMYLVDLERGETRPLAWVGDDAYNPLFSPDGQSIAFERPGLGIFLARLDQGSPVQAPGTSSDLQLIGWTPDGTGLLVIRQGPDGSMVQQVDVSSGETVDLVPAHEDARLSPDGTRIAVKESIFGDWGHGLSVVNLDGSGKHLIATLGAIGSKAVGWSLDGKWLLVAAAEFGLQGVTNYLVVLVNPDTCELIRLPGLSEALIDGVDAWSPAAP